MARSTRAIASPGVQQMAPGLASFAARGTAATCISRCSMTGRYLGRYDTTGWHAASTRSRVRQLRSSQLPAAAGGLSAHGRSAPAIRAPGRPDCLQRRRDEPVVA